MGEVERYQPTMEPDRPIEESSFLEMLSALPYPEIFAHLLEAQLDLQCSLPVSVRN